MSSSPLLALPLELRAIIYAELLDPPVAPRTFYTDDDSASQRQTGVHPAILSVCSQIHAEAEPWLYGSTSPWRLDLGDRTSPPQGLTGTICGAATQLPPVRRWHRPAPLWRAGAEPEAVCLRDAQRDRGSSAPPRNPAGGSGTISAAALGRIRHIELGLGMAKLWRVEPGVDRRGGPGKADNAHWQLVLDLLRALRDADEAKQGARGPDDVVESSADVGSRACADLATERDGDDGPSPYVTVVGPVEHDAAPRRPAAGRKMLTLRCLPDGAACTRRSRWEFATWLADRTSMKVFRWIGSDKVFRMTQGVYALRRLLDEVASGRDVVIVRPVSEGFDSLDHWRVYWDR